MTLQHKYRFIAFVLCFAAAFVWGLSIAHTKFIASWNETQLRQMAGKVLSRTELAIDAAIMKMSDVVKSSDTSCATVGQAALAGIVYSHSIMKNVRLETSSDGVCWAFPEHFKDVEQAIASAGRNRTINPNYSLFSLRFPEWRGLGIRWQYGSEENIVQLLATGGLLFEVLPDQLRDSALMHLSLADGTAFASYSPDKKWYTDGVALSNFEEKSSRYPIRFNLRVDSAALATWNQTLSPSTFAIMIAFGLAFGALAARGLIRPTSVLDEFDAALANGEIQPYYQPIFDLRTRSMLGFEMLARWIKPDGTMISPMTFIPLAEANGRMDRLTSELLKSAGAQVAGLLHAKPDLKLTFNVTPDQYLSDGFVETLVAQGQKFNLPLCALVVEVTERQAIADTEKAARVTTKLFEAGLRVAIDDAGTGHNGLSAIHGLGANYLKIDKFFVDGITLDKKSSELVDMLASLAAKFGMTVVAEGIETEEQIAALLRLGIHEGQGFVYSRPVPAATILAMALRQVAAKTPENVATEGTYALMRA